MIDVRAGHCRCEGGDAQRHHQREPQQIMAVLDFLLHVRTLDAKHRSPRPRGLQKLEGPKSFSGAISILRLDGSTSPFSHLFTLHSQRLCFERAAGGRGGMGMLRHGLYHDDSRHSFRKPCARAFFEEAYGTGAS